MSIVAQRRFASGEIAPAYYAGVDLAKYGAAARTIKNFLVKRSGGLDNRAGLQMVGELPFSFTIGRLIKFVFNDSQTYELAFSDKAMRIIKNGAFVMGVSATPTAITKANPAVVTFGSVHSFQAGDLVDIAGVGGMTQLNGRRFMVKNPSTYTIELYYLDGGTRLNSTTFSTFTSGGTVKRVITIASPYAEADLADLHFNQSADTIILTRLGYVPYKLTRSNDTDWTFTPMVFAIQTTTPTGLSLLRNDGGADVPGGAWGFAVTAVDATTLEESLPSVILETNQDPANDPTRWTQITWSAVANAKYYNIYKHTSHLGQLGHVGTVSAGGLTYKDSFPGAPPDFNNTPPISADPFDQAAAVSAVTKANPGVFTSSGHGFADGTKVALSGFVGMTQLNGLVGLIYLIDANSFNIGVAGVALDTTGFSTYTSGGVVTSLDKYPATSGYYQERLGFGNLNTNPIGAYLSKSGIYKNFSASIPSRDDDTIQFNIVSREVNEIRHLIDAGILAILTAGAEHLAHGDISGVLKPSGINRRQHSAIGSSKVQPLLVGDRVIFIQTQGAQVYDLGIDIRLGSADLKPDELSLLATHLTEGLTVTDWGYQKIPNSIVWARRSDGQFIGLTYVKNQEIVAWHQHSIGDGILDAVENISVIPENGEHAVYFMTKRTIGGVQRRFVERMYSRAKFNNRPISAAGWYLTGAIFLDASLSFDGRNQDGTNPIGVSGGTLWDYTEGLTLTSALSTFVASDVGKQFHMLAPDDSVIRFTVTAYTSATVVTATPNRTIPVALRNSNTWQWARAINTASGLWHLEGKNVSVMGDGFVVASANNANYPVITVANGTVTLPQFYSFVSVGLPITADVETLDIDTANGETIIDKKKLIHEINMHLQNTRGCFFGPAKPDSDATDPLQNLTELAPEMGNDYDTPPPVISDVRKIEIMGEWTTNGRVFVRQVDPLPITLNAIAPSGAIPFGTGT